MIKTVFAVGVFSGLFILNILADIFEVIANLFAFTGIGIGIHVVNFAFDFSVAVVTNIFLFLLGGKFVSVRLIIQIAGQFVELIPIIDALPMRTITLLINAVIYFFKETAEFGQEIAEGLKEVLENQEQQEEQPEEQQSSQQVEESLPETKTQEVS